MKESCWRYLRGLLRLVYEGVMLEGSERIAAVWSMKESCWGYLRGLLLSGLGRSHAGGI